MNWLEEKFTPFEKHLYKVEDILIDTKTQFQNIQLVNLSQYKKALILDGEIQSTELDEFIYHESIVHPAMISNKNPENILILGGGEGGTLREVLKYKSVKKVVMVDIDAEVVSFCKDNLFSIHRGSFDDHRLDLVIMDAKDYVKNSSIKFDVIISDLCCPVDGSPACNLYTFEFYKQLKNILANDGVLIVQSGPFEIQQNKLFPLINSTLSNVFCSVFPFSSFVPSFIVPWSFNLVCNSIDIDVDVLLRERLITNDLLYYDKLSHDRMFVFPKHLRSFLENKHELITEETQYFLFK